MITSVEGKRDQKDIREFVDSYLIAKDARALREYYNKISPDVNMVFIPEDENYTGEGINIPISLNFFWPDVGL
jgi:5S rRNA maturation endonuclease (ribonuclease M5)